VFFFFLLPPIIFEAGYSVDRKGFFENIGAITLYAMLGTLISTFVVGILCFYAAKVGMISGIDKENPMESLMFGALISAVDPVATLSILGNADLGVDPLLYSLVFGESVLNDAIAISLFKTFFQYYKPEGPNWSESEIPAALLSFIVVSFLSIVVGVSLGLACSWLYKHLDLNLYPNLETSLLFCFCYLCYAAAEAMALSGIMALFFQGIVLSHYNSYNLSETAHVASEQIFSTFATLTETIVFVYMGMGVFTGRYQAFDLKFSVIALLACLIGRLLNIVPLSFLANFCRTGRHVISGRHQAVLWFAGLRGAIAFALSENMPGPHKEVYATGTLSICIFTTLVCGGFTERVLSVFGMKDNRLPSAADDDNNAGPDLKLNRLTFKPPVAQRRESKIEVNRRKIREGMKGLWYRFDDQVLKPHFGGVGERLNSPSASVNGRATNSASRSSIREGNIEMGSFRQVSSIESEENENENDDDSDEDGESSQHRSLLH
jgi:sodium/hydrogen exchanger 8